MTSKHVLLITALALALAGCLSARNITPTRHYTVDPKVQVERGKTVDKTLGYRPLEVAQPYERRIAFVTQDHFLGYRDREEWAEKPGDTVTRTIADALANTGCFKDVGDASRLARPELMLTGELRKFQENRTQKPYTAEIEVRLELREARGSGLIWAGTLQAAVPVAGEAKASALADAMAKAVSQVTVDAVKAIAKAL
jgi:ABC-type uncharacterized transport system auxiliary subunit